MNIRNIPLLALAIAIVMTIIVVVDPTNRATPYVVVFGVMAMMIDFYKTSLRAEHEARIEEATFYSDVLAESRRMINDRVDIWDYQDELMRASDQRTEPLPCINSASVLYLALQAEEFAEQIRGVKDGILKALPTQCLGWHEAARILHEIAPGLEYDSKRLRDLIASGRLGDTNIQLDMATAQDILDGVTDVAVVTAGFSLASGMPAREAYKEVGVSNLSKANPRTGKIDKDPSGKWLKGEAYRSPDLQSVLVHQLDRYHAKKADQE